MKIPPKSGLPAPKGWMVHHLDRVNFKIIILYILCAYFGMAAVFAGGYYFINKANGPIFSQLCTQQTSISECAYFSLVTQSTLGYGDLAPIGLAKFVAVFQTFFGILLSGAIVGIIVLKMTKPSYDIIKVTPAIYYHKPEGRFFIRLINNSSIQLNHVDALFSIFENEKIHHNDSQVIPIIYSKHPFLVGFTCPIETLKDIYKKSTKNWLILVSMSFNYGFGTLVKSMSYADDKIFVINSLNDIDLEVIWGKEETKTSFKNVFENYPTNPMKLLDEDWLHAG